MAVSALGCVQAANHLSEPPCQADQSIMGDPNPYCPYYCEAFCSCANYLASKLVCLLLYVERVYMTTYFLVSADRDPRNESAIPGRFRVERMGLIMINQRISSWRESTD